MPIYATTPLQKGQPSIPPTKKPMTIKTKNTASFLTIDAEQAGQRIDNFLLRYLKNVPKSRVYRLVRKGEVRVNKKRIKVDYRLQAEDIVRIPPFWEEPSEPKPKPPQSAVLSIEKYILFEDNRLIVLNKPSGMPVHGGTGVSFGVIDLMRLARPKEKYLELAHRLDRETSGCLLLIKKPSLLKEAHLLFREGKISKIYWALVKGHWPASKIKIDVPLLKNQLKSGERIVTVNAEGKSALTVFKVIRYFEDCTLLEVTLHTGRTHQIRVHAAYAGHPIVGDEKYGDKNFNTLMRKKTCHQMFLHAKHLFLEFPSSGQVVDVDAEVENDWQFL